MNEILNTSIYIRLKFDYKESPSLKILPPLTPLRSTSSANISSKSFNYLTSPVTPRRRFMLQRSQDTSLQDKDQDRLALGSSSSSSTSYLMSPRPLRSKVSNEGCQTSTDSSRHGWLYTQKSFKFNNRYHKNVKILILLLLLYCIVNINIPLL